MWAADFSGIYDIGPRHGRLGADERRAMETTPRSTGGLPSLRPGSWIHNPATGHYYALTDYDLSFSEAESQAQSWGGHLVTIDDQAEQDWLYETFGVNPFWIGFNDVDTEGTFVWTSGAPVTYSNWCDGEPNDPRSSWRGRGALRVRRAVLERRSGRRQHCRHRRARDTAIRRPYRAELHPWASHRRRVAGWDSIVTITVDDPETPRRTTM